MLLRESLSSKGSPLEKLVLRGIDGCLVAGGEPEEAGESAALPHRVNRKLRAAERAELVALYESGMSMLELSRRFGAHRQTVARLLKRGGVDLRLQKKATPQLVAEARMLYKSGHTLAEIGDLVGMEASAVA